MRKNECSFFLRLKVMLPLSSQMGVYCATGGALVALKLNTHFLLMIYTNSLFVRLRYFSFIKILLIEPAHNWTGGISLPTTKMQNGMFIRPE